MTIRLLSPFRVLSPAGARARLSIFIFHRVLPVPDAMLPDDPCAAEFDRIVGFIANHFNVLHLSDAAKRLAAGSLPAASACITFDDGYADNLTVAAPILRRHGVVATFFIATGFIDGGRMWNDTVIEAVRRAPEGLLPWSDLGLESGRIDASALSRVAVYKSALGRLKYRDPGERRELADEIGLRAGLPDRADLMLTQQQLRELPAMGMELGGHTLTHPILKLATDAAAAREIAGCGEQLKGWTGTAPTVFAYPDGRPGKAYGERDVELVKHAGYAVAVTTGAGAAQRGADIFQLPRFTPWDKQNWKFGLRSAMNLFGMAA
jgi:peptidoglycan/xylan/chitin deacetylase (PgdA/CDA1 family)